MDNLFSKQDTANSICLEKKIVVYGAYDRFIHSLFGKINSFISLHTKHNNLLLHSINKINKKIEVLSDVDIDKLIISIRNDLKNGGFTRRNIVKAFALVREISNRVIEQKHYNVQVLGGLAMLQGNIIEMETGEGKTLTATLPVSVAAMSGIPVHVITVNDYLAERDARLMSPIYTRLGLTVGVIQEGMELADRRHAYSMDIVYCTNKEIVFDYLKDSITLGLKRSKLRNLISSICSKKTKLDDLLMRGLCFAVVDEADNVFIDEARTPVVISGQSSNFHEDSVFIDSIKMAQKLTINKDFNLKEKDRDIELTNEGKSAIQNLSSNLTGMWNSYRAREEVISQALSALHIFKLDKDYLISDGKIQIIDEYTGRVMEDRSWEKGLHQLIEVKEGVDITEQKTPLARISYQRFFRKYLNLAGMTGTAQEVSSELWDVYNLNIIKIPTNKISKRISLQKRIFMNNNAKWVYLIERISTLNQAGRPVLVGTRSVGTSEYISEMLTEYGLEHKVLNARQNTDEASIIEKAGDVAKITVATNMAGRGTDIPIAEEVSQLEGLHVILTERYDARRIDRQLFGRCARQGDPGSYEELISIQDELIEHNTYAMLIGSIKYISRINREISKKMVNVVSRSAQKRLEARHLKLRRSLLRHDEKLGDMLAFTNVLE